MTFTGVQCYMTEAQLCEELQVGRVWLYHRRQEGMPYLRLGSRTVRYELQEVLEWLKREKAALEPPRAK